MSGRRSKCLWCLVAAAALWRFLSLVSLAVPLEDAGGTPGLLLSYPGTVSFSVWMSPFPLDGKWSPANTSTSGCHGQAYELLANCRFFMSRHGKIRRGPTTQGTDL